MVVLVSFCLETSIMTFESFYFVCEFCHRLFFCFWCICCSCLCLFESVMVIVPPGKGKIAFTSFFFFKLYLENLSCRKRREKYYIVLSRYIRSETRDFQPATSSRFGYIQRERWPLGLKLFFPETFENHWTKRSKGERKERVYLLNSTTLCS